MATVDPTNVLFKIAHPYLYARNPFNLLNLPVNATAKDIRRRREDIEAAFDTGTEAEEFKFVLPLDESREPPTHEAVDEAFAALEDPEMRMAYALFWFWPTDICPKLKCNDIDDAIIEKWESESGNSLVYRHNLAAYRHFMALAIEEKLRDCPSLVTDETAILAHWQNAISLWNSVVSEADFWHLVSEMVSSLNDPRLDYRFARSLRDQFAFAFDLINVELAIAFAKARRESDAKRQVEYMKLSQPDADDIDGTFDDAFSGLLRQTEAICKTARAEANKNPNDGLNQANLILEQTDEPLRVSRIVLEKGTAIRNAIVTTIFSAVRNCLIAYGNKTADWDCCLKLTARLKDLAETSEQTAIAMEDEKVILGNIKTKEEEETCWFCKRKYDLVRKCIDHPVSLYGEIRKGYQFGQVLFSQRTVSVPVCSECQWKADYSSFPTVKALLSKGWRQGREPSQSEIRSLWGIPDPTPQPTPSSGCLVPLVILFGLLLLAVF